MHENKLARGKTIIRRDFMKGTILGTLGIILKQADSAAQSKASVKEFVTQAGVEMFQIPSGSFIMGDKNGDVDEIPHNVSIDSFCIDKYLVTQEEYEKVMGENIAMYKRSGWSEMQCGEKEGHRIPMRKALQSPDK